MSFPIRSLIFWISLFVFSLGGAIGFVYRSSFLILLLLCIYVWILLLIFGLFFSLAILQQVIPSVLKITYFCLVPIVFLLRNFPGITTIVELICIVTIAIWFRILLLFDTWIRNFLQFTFSSLRHPSGSSFSIINASVPHFSPCGQFDEDSSPFLNENRRGTTKFSGKSAVSCANLSRLVYEDEPLIKYELEKEGFDASSLRLVHYRNTVGICARKKNKIIVSWRGTDPLNLMHIFTDLRIGQVSLSVLDESDEKGMSDEAIQDVLEGQLEGKSEEKMGRVHFGFVDALRVGKKTPEQIKIRKRKDSEQNDNPSSNKNDINGNRTIILEGTSVNMAISSAIQAIGFAIAFAWNNIKLYATNPIDSKFRHERNITAYQQMTTIIEELDPRHRCQIIICGHSLGGALGFFLLLDK
eukprot:TRINITY_DN7276_c0_g1_i1.p1 TRINITY_DN7276_c0_g1~~TRINITY_DN7276_c0_g1_i1.p1  ORF type:complete len:413 (+),score=58.78 TRINITY_DN7276_c0_g1_i1:126-1364(+)